LLPFHTGKRKQLARLDRIELEQLLANQLIFATPEARQDVLPPLLSFYRFKDPVFHRIASTLHVRPATPAEALASESGVAPVAFEQLCIFDFQAPPLRDCAAELLDRLIAERINNGLAWNDVYEARQTLQQPTTPAPSPFVNLADVDLTGNLAPSWLIKGYLEQDSLAVLFGPPGSGKSFTALALCMAIATGSTWNGQPVEHGVVVYLAGEGHAGLRRRLKAWLQHYNHPAPETLILSINALPLDEHNLKKCTTGAQAAADRAGLPVRLFVIDTLARHLVGDENSATDMGAFIRIADSLKAAFPGSAVLIVHHTSKADRDSGRGSSSLKGAADCEIRCMDHCLTFTKMKDSTAPEPVMFKLRQVQIGLTSDGEPITSCIPEYGGTQGHDAAVPAAVQLLTRHEQQALEALQAACIAENRPNHAGQYAATVKAWRIEFYRLRRIEEPDETDNTLKTQFQRVRFGTGKGGGLSNKHVVHVAGLDAVLLRLADNQTVHDAIQANGTRYAAGTQPVHVPADEGGTRYTTP